MKPDDETNNAEDSETAEETGSEDVKETTEEASGEENKEASKAAARNEVNERKKLFLVDDTEFSLIRTKQFLKDYYTVYAIDNAVRMFLLLEKVIPDLILLDIDMPGMDGYEAIKKLKNDERFVNIPVIFLSGKYDEDSIIRGLEYGAVDHIIKPYTPKDLLDRITLNLYPLKFHDDLQIDRDKNVSKQQSILVVDDSPSILRSMQFALKAKYRVHTLQKPENLKKNIKSLNPDLILIDYNMPVINGPELIKIVREFPEFRKTPIIVVTSDFSPEHLTEAINLGIKDFIKKPINPKKLREKISACMPRD